MYVKATVRRKQTIALKPLSGQDANAASISTTAPGTFTVVVSPGLLRVLQGRECVPQHAVQ